MVQMSSEVEDLLQARNRQIQDLTEQVHLLEEGLAKAQQNTKDARKQVEHKAAAALIHLFIWRVSQHVLYSTFQVLNDVLY